jgi:xanthine dehydrogenase accessory factor
MNVGTTKAALSLLEEGEGFAWVTILDTRGSSPRHAGAAMLVRADGAITGTIGGGPLEASAIKQALEVLETKRTRVTDFDSAQLGMMCGGGGLVLIEYVDPTDSATRDLLLSLLELLGGGRRGWLVTALPDGADAEGPVRRSLVDSLHSVINAPAGTYVQPVGAQGTAYVFGAGHCGEKLVPVLGALGFFTVIVDDRADFANRERFPAADRIVVAKSFDGVVETLPIDDDSYIVIMTRGHQHDRSVLEQALRTQAGYVGMMGSKRKVAVIVKALRDEGFSPNDIARLHAPVGLPIGAETPEEIAISIAAELIQVRSGEGR